MNINRVPFYLLFVWIQGFAAAEIPQLASVSHGSAAMTTRGNTSTITTGAGTNVANFHSFGVPRGHTVDVKQGSASSRSLFQVGNANPSHIYGALNVDQGELWLANPEGVFFHDGSVLNADKFFAVAGHVDPNDFLGDNPAFSITGDVRNAATVTIKKNGMFGIFGRSVINTGHVSGQQIRVEQLSGDKVWVTFNGNDIMAFRVEGAIRGGNITVEQDATITTEGGPVYMSVHSAEQIVRECLRVDGVIDASQSTLDADGSVVFEAGSKGGNVTLDAKDHRVVVSGSISTAGDASGDVALRGRSTKLVGHATLTMTGGHHAGTLEFGGKRILPSGAFDASMLQRAPLSVTADEVFMGPGVKIFADRRSEGQGPNLFFMANQDLDIKGTVDSIVYGEAPAFIEFSNLEGELVRPDRNLFRLKNARGGSWGPVLFDPKHLVIGPDIGEPETTYFPGIYIEAWVDHQHVILHADETLAIRESIHANSSRYVAYFSVNGDLSNITLEAPATLKVRSRFFWNNFSKMIHNDNYTEYSSISAMIAGRSTSTYASPRPLTDPAYLRFLDSGRGTLIGATFSKKVGDSLYYFDADYGEPYLFIDLPAVAPLPPQVKAKPKQRTLKKTDSVEETVDDFHEEGERDGPKFEDKSTPQALLDRSLASLTADADHDDIPDVVESMIPHT